MLLLFAVVGVYFVLALISVSAVWWMIGRKGFDGLEDTDSPLAKFFKRRRVAVATSGPIATSGTSV